MVFNEFLCEKCFLTFDLDFWKTAPCFLLTTKLFWKYENCRVEWYMTQPYNIHDDQILEKMSLVTELIELLVFISTLFIYIVNTRFIGRGRVICIVLSVLLRYTDSDSSFGIFKLFLRWSYHVESFTVATMTWLIVMEYLCHKWPMICSTCRKHFHVLS